MARPVFDASGGTPNAKVAILGEAWGANEAILHYPFVGQTGLELARMLNQAGICDTPPRFKFHISNFAMKLWWDKQPVFTTNVFATKPLNNKIDNLCTNKIEATLEAKALGYDKYPYKALSSGKYVHPKYFPEIERLKSELEEVEPNLVICCGGTSTWALTGDGRISSVRGAISESTLIQGLKILPTYHPSAVVRSWNLRPVVVNDLRKAKRELEFPDIRRPRRLILVNPTIEEIEHQTEEWLKNPPKELGCDIETVRDQVWMISFAPDPYFALIIPFIDKTKPGWSYWDDPRDELRAWKCKQKLLMSGIPLTWQNGAAFDLIRINRVGLKFTACQHDTMLMSHALWPEMPKALGFMGSIHTDEPAWKLMNVGREELKRDE